MRFVGRLLRLLALLPGLVALAPDSVARAAEGPRLSWRPQAPGDGKPVLFVLAGVPSQAPVSGEFLAQKLSFAWAPTLGAHVALAAVPLGTDSGPQGVEVRAGEGAALGVVKAVVPVRALDYPRAEVRLREKPSSAKGSSEKDKVPGETPIAGGKLVKAALARETAARLWSLPLHRPLASRVTEHFGVRRTYLRLRGKKVVRRWKGRHMGLDLDGDGGEPIGAVAAGEVVLAGYYLGMGKAVLVDHGQRFFTAYFHMSRLGVKVGQTVARGETLGFVGATGLATGPHLHLSARINGARVDPLALFSLLLPMEAGGAKAGSAPTTTATATATATVAVPSPETPTSRALPRAAPGELTGGERARRAARVIESGAARR